MEKLICIIVFIFSQAVSAQDADYWELYETYAAADAAKYHDILQSMESGDLNAAKEKLLSYQAGEVLVLEKLREERAIKDSAEAVIKLVRQYNKIFLEQ